MDVTDIEEVKRVARATVENVASLETDVVTLYLSVRREIDRRVALEIESHAIDPTVTELTMIATRLLVELSRIRAVGGRH